MASTCGSKHFPNGPGSIAGPKSLSCRWLFILKVRCCKEATPFQNVCKLGSQQHAGNAEECSKEHQLCSQNHYLHQDNNQHSIRRIMARCGLASTKEATVFSFLLTSCGCKKESTMPSTGRAMCSQLYCVAHLGNVQCLLLHGLMYHCPVSLFNAIKLINAAQPAISQYQSTCLQGPLPSLLHSSNSQTSTWRDHSNQFCW